MATKNRAVLILINDRKILLMYRFKNGEEYYVFPGGGVEENETLEQAAIREAKEETGLTVTLKKKLWECKNGGRTDNFYLVDAFSGDMKIGGPEEARQSESNVYRLDWIPLNKVKDLNLFPEAMKNHLLEEFF